MSWDDSPVVRAVFAVAGLGRVEWADPTHAPLPPARPRGAACDADQPHPATAPAADPPRSIQDETR